MSVTPSGTSAATPELTAEDVSILRLLASSDGPGERSHVIGRRIANPTCPWQWLTVTGLQTLGYVEHRSGWWKRTPAGDAYLHALDAPPAHQGALV